MELIRVIQILELLLFKKHNSTIKKKDEELLNELQTLVKLANKLNESTVKTECKCELKEHTLVGEIVNNKCLDCGLPLVVF